MGALEPPHLILVLVLVLIIFGPGKLPQLGKAVGDGLRELKRATGEEPAAGHEFWTCSRCHAAVLASDRFCGACGASRDTPAAA